MKDESRRRKLTDDAYGIWLNFRLTQHRTAHKIHLVKLDDPPPTDTPDVVGKLGTEEALHDAADEEETVCSLSDCCCCSCDCFASPLPPPEQVRWGGVGGGGLAPTAPVPAAAVPTTSLVLRCDPAYVGGGVEQVEFPATAPEVSL